ncbi:MAG: (2Fe-2S) ferredoxin domain-containing protein [Candidatus Izimaplasma sp.]|nr:(2Fe-2S) ferredoxin domain-containing protein [Candidatus Izimaplasma bacterium]
MKSLDDLKKIRDAAQRKVTMRDKQDGIRILVGMATCGISAGARPVMNKFVEEITNRDIKNVTVTPVGCIGECSIEPIVEVLEGDNRTTYCRVDEDVAQRILDEHILGGKVVKDNIIGKFRV